MSASNSKRPGGTATDRNHLVLLLPNTEGQGNYHSEWLESAKTDASNESESTALYLTCLDTGNRYIAPFPTIQTVTAANTQPAIPAGPGQAAVAAIVPADNILENLLLEEFRLRTRQMNSVKNSATPAFNFFRTRCSTGSWAIISEHADFAAADGAVPKDGFGLYRIIVQTHALGGAGGIRLSSQEVDRIDEGFNAFQQKGLELGEYYRLFKIWLDKRRAVGIADLTERTTVAKFYGKLNQDYYYELLRERENTERALHLANMPIPNETLAASLAHVRGWKAPNNVKTNGSAARSVSVFCYNSD